MMILIFCYLVIPVLLLFRPLYLPGLVALVTRNPTISRLNIGYCDKLTHEVIPAIAVTLANELVSILICLEEDDLFQDNYPDPVVQGPVSQSLFSMTNDKHQGQIC